MTWHTRAECVGIPPVEFVGPNAPTLRARAACSRCPVRGNCLTEDLVLAAGPHEIVGYRAGLAEHERRRTWRQRRTTRRERL